MQDQGQCDKTHHFKEKIHGQNIIRHGDTQSDSIGNNIKHIKRFFVVVFIHIFKGVQHRRRPEHRRHGGEHPSQPVQMETYPQIAGKAEQDKCLLRLKKQHDRNQYGIEQHQSLHIPKQVPPAFKRKQRDQYTSQDGKQHHHDHHRNMHCHFSFCL